MSVGLLIIRWVVGLTLAAHGSQKLFGWFGGGGLAGTAPMMEQLGFRPAILDPYVLWNADELFWLPSPDRR